MAIQCFCRKCGKEFSVTPSQLRDGCGKYCSRKCRDLDKVTSVMVACEHCHKPFESQLHRSKSGRGKFCSKECHNQYKRKRITVVCQCCSKEFEVTDSQSKRGKGKYCSVACKKAATVERNKRICESCGKEFVANPYMIEQGAARFCSKACLGTWISKSLRGENNYRWAGGTSLVNYPTEFSRKFKAMIIQRDGGVCSVCRLPSKLDVHHIDYNKKNTVPENCISLCRTCHGICHAGSKKTRVLLRQYWCDIFTKLVEIRTRNEPECTTGDGTFRGSAAPSANAQ